MQAPRFVSGFLILSILLFFSQCNHPQQNTNSALAISNDTSAVSFPFFLSEKTMIVNEEQDNELEGHYLKVLNSINDSTIQINLPKNFYLNQRDHSSWILGWHTGNTYYDAGNENLREIISIDNSNNQIVLGKILRGDGYPQKNQRVVFWNRSPSGFKNSTAGKLVNPKWWKVFAGESVEFGAIVFDSLRSNWIMYAQEVDNDNVKIYAATSPDLIHWSVVKNGATFFEPKDFANTEWAGFAEDGKTPQTARMYSVVYEKGTYFFFLSGYGKNGKRHIGLLTATDPLNGPFTIHPQPIISPDSFGCDKNGCFYPKICKAKNKFLLYYDGVNAEGIESLCLAESENLLGWKKFSTNPVIAKHYGWRSGSFTSEPNYAKYSNDSVWVMIGGYKKYNTEFNLADSIQNRLPQDKTIFSSAELEKGKCISGNVMDAELGVFLSTDGGYTFRPHINNPVWINDYSDTLQNDHIGGDFFHHGNLILYQAKSETQKRYNILLREKH